MRPALVPRPRLIERMKESLHRKLPLISSPAGFGETTLRANGSLATGKPKRRFPVAWHSLDGDDDNLNRFLAYPVTALQTIEGNDWFESLTITLEEKASPSLGRTGGRTG
jgi:LuxR family maltose regulon positive regulatory protein